MTLLIMMIEKVIYGSTNDETSERLCIAVYHLATDIENRVYKFTQCEVENDKGQKVVSS